MKRITHHAENGNGILKKAIPDPSAWAAREDELASWTLTLLVNRVDVWGGYRPLEHRNHIGESGEPVGKNVTRPPKSRRGQEQLQLWHLVQHYRGERPEHVVGLHTTSPGSTSRWCAAEIDWHRSGPAPEANQAAALGWYAKLSALGFHPLLTTSNDNGGYHLRAIFSEPVATEHVYAFCRWLVSDFENYGLSAPPETFPKQPRVGSRCPFGNWLRLPGRHHTNPHHWSLVWDGQRWLAGHEAIDFLLALRGDPPSLLPSEAQGFQSPPAAEEGLSLSSVRIPTTHENPREPKPPVPSVSSCVNQRQLREVIAATIPDGPHQTHRRLFDLARVLKALMPESRSAELQEILVEWHRQALPFLRENGFSACWLEFSDSWPRVRLPDGVVFQTALERARMLPPPAAAKPYADNPRLQLLIGLCAELQQIHGDKPFFLGCRECAEAIGVDRTTASKWLRMLVFSEVLTLVAKERKPIGGEKGRTREYRYNG